MKKHLLIIRSGYPSKEFVLKRLKELGYYIIVLDSEKNASADLVDEWIIADPYDAEVAVNAIQQYKDNPKNHIDGVLTFWEEAVLTTAAITDTLHLPGISYKSAESIKNKHLFRELCANSGLPTTKSHLLTNTEDFAHIENTMTFPLVIKPLYGAASAFVMKVNSMNDLKKAYTSITESIHTFWLAPEWQSTDLYVEEYIDGQEVDIDILLQDGVCLFAAVTDNFQTQEPFFIETGQALPSSLTQKEQHALIEMALSVLKAAGVTNGSIHFEAKSSSKGPVPVEVNLRMGGDHVYSFIKDGWGVCMIESAAAIACGEHITIEKPEKPHMYLEGKYFEPTKSGVIHNITFPQDIESHPSFVKMQLDMKINDTVKMPPYGFDFFGWMTVRGNTKEEAVTHLEHLFPLVTFDVR